jgi:hypothetical protein
MSTVLLQAEISPLIADNSSSEGDGRKNSILTENLALAKPYNPSSVCFAASFPSRGSL